jgi:hypothetical protein
VNGPTERSEHEHGGEDTLSRLLSAVVRLERTATPEAAEALARAASALDRLSHRLGDPSRECGGAAEVMAGDPHGLAVGATIEEIELDGGKLVGRVMFPDVSPEGSSWVDAGSVTSVFQEFLDGLSSRLGGTHRAASVSVDFMSLTPRNRMLSVTAWTGQADGRETCLFASLCDGPRTIAEARGRFVWV